MFSNRKLQKAVRLGLGIGAGAFAVGFAPGAIAQSTSSADEPIEEIITTGSRIKRADLESASPVTVIDREAIMSAGITDVGNLIQRMPSMSGTPLGTTTNNGNTNEGAVQIDLRGMGPDRTVTLINGRRTVDGGDYTTIPSIMIERVEILKDGASAIYGADAVAGVVNIITRKDFEGVNVDITSSDWFNTDNGEQVALSMIAGKNFDGGNFVFGAEYVDQKEAFQRDTPWDFLKGSYYVYYDTDQGCETNPVSCTFFGSSRIPESRIQFATPGGLETTNPSSASATFMIPSPGAVMTPYDGRSYNYAPVNYMQTPYSRINYFGEGTFDVSDDIQFSASFRGTERRSDQELAPLPYDSNIYPSYAGSFNGAAYNGISEQNYYVTQAISAYNAANGTSFAPEPVTNVRRRMVERPRHFAQDVTQFQATMGFAGTIGDGMDWEVYYNRGKRAIANYDTGQFSGVRLTGALGPSADLDGDGTPECYSDLSDPGSLITGCVPLNLFAGEGAVTDAEYDWVAVETVDTRISQQEIWGASITGSAFDLPGGELGWAVGASYRGEAYKFTPDSAKSIGAVTGGTTQGTDGTLYSKAFFGEVYAPLFDNGTQSLALKGGARYDDYNLFGDDTTWQLGIEFQALDSLKLRATAGTAFRAPGIDELYDGLGRSAPSYYDPCDASDYASNHGGNGTNFAPGCAQEANRTDTQTTSLIGGNLALVPETADTYTAGFVFTPEFGDGGLSLTVDWWRIELDKAISSYGVQYILNQCYIEGVQEQCNLITRRLDVDYTIRDIIDGNVNVATQTGEGVDTEVRYDFDTSFGQFELSLLWAHLLERSKTALPGDPVEDLLGRHTNTTAEDGGTYAEDKMNFSARYHVGDFTISYLAEYISGVDATATYQDYTYGVPSLLYHDLVLDYTLDAFGETRLTLGVTNLTDEEPPYIDPGFNANTDPNTYRVFGTGYFLRLSQTF
jgi:outer membrane receptor protein involved in Fe transport